MVVGLVGVSGGSGGGIVYNNTIQWALRSERDRRADTKHDGRHRLIKVIIMIEKAAAS